MLNAINGLVQASEDPAASLYVLKNLQSDGPRLSTCAKAMLRHCHRRALLRLQKLATSTRDEEQIELVIALQPPRIRLDIPLAGVPNHPLRPLLNPGDLALQQAIVKDLLLREMLERQIDAIRLEKSILQGFEKYDRHELAVRMRDPSPVVRFLAIQSAALRHIHCEEELINRLKDPVPAIRVAARNALVRLSRGADFGPTRAGAPASAANARDSNQAMANWRAWLRKQEETPSTNEE